MWLESQATTGSPVGLTIQMTNLTQHKLKDPSISAEVSNKWWNGRACAQA